MFSIVSTYHIMRLLRIEQVIKDSKSRSKTCLIKTNPTYENVAIPGAEQATYNVRNLCRVCLKHGKILIYGTSTIQALKVITDIDIIENKDCPRYLCEKCYSSLKEAMDFRKMAQETDRFIQKQLQTVSHNILLQPLNEGHSLSQDDDALEPGSITPTVLPGEVVIHVPSHGSQVNTSNPDIASKTTTTISRTSKCYNKNRTRFCNICDKQLNYHYYKNHMEFHHGTSSTAVKECKICKKRVRASYYPRHMIDIHQQGPSRYLCEVCGQKYHHISGYKEHMLTHTTEFAFKCQLCPYRGQRKSLLMGHMKQHNLEFKYQCTECPAKFKISNNFRKHMQIHTEGEFKCEECQKAFHSQLLMERHHKVVHLGHLNHVCDVCGKAFGYRKQMMKHTKKVHKRKPNGIGRMPKYLEAQLSENTEN